MKTLKYLFLLAVILFAGKANAQELRTEVFPLLNLDYPGLEKLKLCMKKEKMQMRQKRYSLIIVTVLMYTTLILRT